MTDAKLTVEKLIAYAKNFLQLNDLDELYIRNFLLRELRLPAPYDGPLDLAYIKEMSVPDPTLDELTDYAVREGIAAENERERFAARIMGILTPLPSEVNRVFRSLREKFGPQEACDYLYDLSIKNNYIQKTAISKNLKWEAKDGNNVLEITINLSKPEKDNKEIAKAVAAPQKAGAKYPACLLCKENEGFAGTDTHPARGNLRTIGLKLGGEEWFVQYSPYSYYDEHCIAINRRHVPMRVNAATIGKLLDFVDFFPNYFIGSNASLPIVGGSILAHEHFQGGRHVMPMHRAAAERSFRSERYPSVEISMLDWYNSVVRLVSSDRAAIDALAGEIVEAWSNYDAPEENVVSHTGETPHNAVTPIVRMVDKKYCVELILRNNRTSEEFPDGIFHAHPEHHNIKKEGIGIIEVMGLFILPGRLKKQLAAVKDILTGAEPFPTAEEIGDPAHPLYAHRFAVARLAAENGTANEPAKAEKIVRDYVNRTCAEILDNTGVFKRTPNGRAAFAKFLSSLGIASL